MLTYRQNVARLAGTPRKTGLAAAMPELPPLKFSYGVVEKALAVAYGISAEQRRGGFRSFIGHLQKLGTLGAQARVGRGVALNYTPIEMHRLLLAVELAELGVSPATTVAILNRHWEPTLQGIIDSAHDQILRDEPGGADVILCLVGVGFRTGSLRGEALPGAPNIEQCSLDELPAKMTRWMAAAPNDPPRALVVNFSARLRVFHSALNAAYMDEATRAGAPGAKSRRGRFA